MSLEDNLYNAFEVVNKTHENVKKLIDYCKYEACEKGEFVLSAPKFLRYKSDNNYWTWCTNSFILLFQDASDPELKNEWRNGPIYFMEINLYNPECYDQPIVTIAKCSFKNIRKFPQGCSPANHNIFYDILYGRQYEEYMDNIFIADVDDNTSKKCWGAQRVAYEEIPLVEITGENAYDKIFGGFRKLKGIK